MDEDLPAVVALLWLLLVLALLVPVEVALRPEDLAAVAEQLLHRLLGAVLHVDPLVLRQVAAEGRKEWTLPSVSDIFHLLCEIQLDHHANTAKGRQ